MYTHTYLSFIYMVSVEQYFYFMGGGNQEQVASSYDCKISWCIADIQEETGGHVSLQSQRMLKRKKCFLFKYYMLFCGRNIWQAAIFYIIYNDVKENAVRNCWQLGKSMRQQKYSKITVVILIATALHNLHLKAPDS